MNKVILFLLAAIFLISPALVEPLIRFDISTEEESENPKNAEEDNCVSDLTQWIKASGWVYDDFVEDLRGPYYDLWAYGDEVDGRLRNTKKPGDYLIAPGNYTEKRWRFSAKESEWLKSILRERLAKEYDCPQIISYCKAYDGVLGDSTRTEYYGTLQINGRKLAMGGWFGKLAVFGFFDSYNGVDEFLKKANDYFNLPTITPDMVEIKRKDEKYFYSVLDRENRYWLRGYALITVDELREHHPWDVIELLLFYDEEFVP